MACRHAIIGYSKNAVGYDIDADPLEVTSDEWTYTQLVTADDDGDSNQDSDKFHLHLLGTMKNKVNQD